MSTRSVYLIAYRNQLRERSHFSIWIPYQNGTYEGTITHVIGAPMAGFSLEFKRGYDPELTTRKYVIKEIGLIDTQHVHGWTGSPQRDSNPISNFEQVAAQIQPPGICENFLTPVNDTTNRRCQEWTMEFLRRLVALNYLESSAVDIVSGMRDPPTHGIFGLQGGLGRGHHQPQIHQPQAQQPQAQQPQAQQPQSHQSPYQQPTQETQLQQPTQQPQVQHPIEQPQQTPVQQQ